MSKGYADADGPVSPVNRYRRLGPRAWLEAGIPQALSAEDSGEGTEHEACAVTLGETRGIPHLSGGAEPSAAVTPWWNAIPAETTICRRDR